MPARENQEERTSKHPSLYYEIRLNLPRMRREGYEVHALGTSTITPDSSGVVLFGRHKANEGMNVIRIGTLKHTRAIQDRLREYVKRVSPTPHHNLPLFALRTELAKALLNSVSEKHGAIYTNYGTLHPTGKSITIMETGESGTGAVEQILPVDLDRGITLAFPSISSKNPFLSLFVRRTAGKR